jgi:hypothetical protein
VVSDRSQKRSPPYVSYRTFQNFLVNMKHEMPARIDRSYWDTASVSGSTGTQLLAALRFFGLVDIDNVPTPRLRQLAASEGSRRSELLRQIGGESYDFILKSLDMKSATYQQLTECFQHNCQLTGDVSRKCIKFFILYANAAEIPLSSYITKKKVHANTSAKTTKSAKTTPPRTKQNSEIPLQNVPDNSVTATWCQGLLAKFPAFDPGWKPELQTKWFDAYRELQKMNPVVFRNT